MDDETIAISIIKKHQGRVYGIYIDTLAQEISSIVYNNPGIVYQVFVQLQVMGYDSSTIIGVARKFLDSTEPAVLNQIAPTRDGSILLKKVDALLKCELQDNQGAARCMKIQTVFPQGTNSTQVAARQQPNQTGQPRELSQTEMDDYTNYNQTNLIFYERNGKGKLMSSGGRRNDFDANVRWELPTSGTGFVVYNRDDLSRSPCLKTNAGLTKSARRKRLKR